MNNDYIRERLLRDRDPNESGSWHVYGEDPNCDLGGPHHEPYLGVFKGRFADVVDKALALPSFFTWGSGGRIDKAHITEVTYAEPKAPTKKALRAERSRLQKRIKEIDAKLNG